MSISLLSLLPPKEQLEEFQLPAINFIALDKIIDNLDNNEDKQEILTQQQQQSVLPEYYPSYRRQKRLSFSAGLLLENVNELTDYKIQSFRHALLRIPSVRGRLLYL